MNDAAYGGQELQSLWQNDISPSMRAAAESIGLRGDDDMTAAVLDEIIRTVEAEEGDVEEILAQMAKTCQEHIKAGAPKKSGKYARSWKIVRVMTIIGPEYWVQTKDSLRHPNAGMASWFENGTAERVTKRGQKRGKMPKKIHIRSAFEQAVAQYDSQIKGR